MLTPSKRFRHGIKTGGSFDRHPMQLTTPQASSPRSDTTDDRNFENSSYCPSVSSLNPTNPNLTDLPVDNLECVFSYLNASEVDGSVSQSCMFFRDTVRSSNIFWKGLCQRTGKLPSPLRDNLNFRTVYYGIPCVPYDFPSITEALGVLKARKNEFGNIDQSVTVMPGIYREKINISDGMRVTISSMISHRNFNVRSGAAIVWFNGDDTNVAMNQPCISVSGDLRAGAFARFIGFRILHSASGNDIWAGNCAAFCDGPGARLILDACTLQSDSGRGLVATRGSSVTVAHTSIHDCAATGVYIGDQGTYATIRSSNVIRNGHGNLDSVEQQQRQLAIIPSGHSGMYVECAQTLIKNSLIGENSLTGLSVVRGGSVVLRNSDIVSNGAIHQVTVDDNGVEHNEGVIEGDNLRSTTGPSIIQEFLSNNFNGIPSTEISSSEPWAACGGIVRTPRKLFPDSLLCKTSCADLENQYGNENELSSVVQ